jgi:hypothetical protein
MALTAKGICRIVLQRALPLNHTIHTDSRMRTAQMINSPVQAIIHILTYWYIADCIVICTAEQVLLALSSTRNLQFLKKTINFHCVPPDIHSLESAGRVKRDTIQRCIMLQK